jgi:HEAT repeat protein
MALKNLGKATIAEADNLLKLITSDDKQVRSFAWQSAGKIGAPAVKKLAAHITHENIEVGWAAKRALREIVRYVGRPFGVSHAKEDVISELIPLLGSDQPTAVRREVLWLLADIAGDESVDPVAGLLGDAELREDARMVLEHIPGGASLAALKTALAAAPDDFKINIAQSLRKRGVSVPGLPCQKLVPTKKTNVKPVK